MERTRIKICGVRDVDTAKVAADAGADYVGVNFDERSPRFVTVEQASVIVNGMPDRVEAVGLFVDASAEAVRRTAADVGLKTVQLHGDETAQFVRELAPLGVIKAAHKADAIAPFTDCATALLFDAPPHSDQLPGGTGRKFDWEALATIDRSDWPPIFVAGGLTADNVGRAIELIRPFAVDVSSGVESAPGVKSHQKIQAFCAAVRAADQTR